MKGMSKGIGPNKLGSPNKMGHMSKSAAKIMKKSPLEIGMDKSAVKKMHDGKKPIVNTDEMGRKGHFNPFTKDGVKLGKTDYSQPYQNKELSLKSQKKRGIRGYTMGDQEKEMKSKFRRDNVIGMRAEAFTAKENKFGIKKPKVNIK